MRRPREAGWAFTRVSSEVSSVFVADSRSSSHLTDTMAAEKMKMVAGHLTCPICCEMYKKPKYLPCYHSYCEECLVKLQVEANIICPECRKVCAIPSGGVKDLPNNFFVNRIVDEMALKDKIHGEEDVKCDTCIRDDPGIVLCVECAEFLCSTCYDHHKYGKEYQGHQMMVLKDIRSEKKDIKVRPKAKPMLCQEHEMELNFYCETCEQLVCHYCTTKEHFKHDHNTVKKIANKQRAKLDEIIEPVGKMIDGLAKASKEISSTRVRIMSQTAEVERQIDTYYEQIWQQLQKQRNQLKEELHGVSTLKKKAVSIQLEQLEFTQAQLESVRELNNAVKSGSDQETVLVVKQVAEDVERLTGDYNKIDRRPVESTNMEFIPEEEDKISLPQFGHLVYDDADPLNSEVHVTQQVFVGSRISIRVMPKDHHSRRPKASTITVQAQAKTEDPIAIPLLGDQDGSYAASFLVNKSGKVNLSVTVNGGHTQGSPYSVQIRQHSALDKPSKIVNDDGKMGQPWGIAFGKDGVWAVIDFSNDCVCIYDSQDQLLRKFGFSGTENGQFSRSEGLAFSANNHLYVVENGNHRVQKFEIDGNYLLQFGKRGSGNGELCHPVGITIHNDRVMVADNGNHRISVFHCDGRFSHTFGSGLLMNPYDVTVSNNNQILVAEWGHHSISIFTLDGYYVSNISTQGSSSGQLNHPSGVAVDLFGFILISDSENNRISIFDKDGSHVHCFGSSGSGDGQFSTPRGIACSPNGSIYVSDSTNKRIQVFADY